MRAEAALDAGFTDHARAALDEARQLDPASPALAAVEQRLSELTQPPPIDAPASRRAITVAAWVSVAAVLAGLIAVRSPSRNQPALAGDIVTRSAAADDGPVATPGVAAENSVRTQTTLVTAPIAPPLTPLTPRDLPPRDEIERAPKVTPDAVVGRQTGAANKILPAVDTGSPPPPPPSAPPVTPIETLPVESLALPLPAPAPAPVNEPLPAHVPERPTPPDQSAAVRAALARYEAAYSNLNAAAARAVWPAVDEHALARAFEGLESQRVSLGQCDVTLNGALARATCAGSAAWTPKVGGGGQRTAARRWAFDLKNAGGAWQIIRADAR